MRVAAPAALASGLELSLDGKVIGHVTTAAGRAGLAYVHRSVDDGATLDGGVQLV